MPDRTLREIVRVLASRFLGMAVIFVVVVAAAAVVTFLLPREYRSESQLLVRPTRALNPLQGESTSLRDEVQLFVATQREILLSDYVLASALMRLDGIPPGVAPPPADEATPLYTDTQVEAFIRENPERIHTVRRERVQVTVPGNTHVTFTQTIRVIVDWPEQADHASGTGESIGERAARRAHEMNAHIVDAYLRRQGELERRRAERAAEFLQTKALAAARAQLDAASEGMARFVSEELGGDLLAVISMSSDSVGGFEPGVAGLSREFTAEMHRIDAELAETRALLDEIRTGREVRPDDQVVIPDAILEANPSIRTIQERAVELNLKLANLRPRFTDAYREVVDLRAELDAVRAELRAELDRQAHRLNQRMRTLQARRESIARNVREDRRRLDEVATQVALYQRLMNDLRTAERIYETEQRKLVEASTARELASNPVLVNLLDDPSMPSPDSPRRPIVCLNLLIAAAAGAVLALVYAFLADHFDHTVKGIDDAERLFDLPVIASLPRFEQPIIRTREDARPAGDRARGGGSTQPEAARADGGPEEASA